MLPQFLQAGDFGQLIHALQPVSYTHLDVYKRQHQQGAGKGESGPRGQDVDVALAQLPGVGERQPGLPPSPEPVSYTHLLHFLRIGTFLERADNTARLLDVKYQALAGGDYFGPGLGNGGMPGAQQTASQGSSQSATQGAIQDQAKETQEVDFYLSLIHI